MTINVPQDVEDTINTAVRSGQFASADEMVARLVLEYDRRTRPQPEARPSTAAGQPIWERILERTAGIPDQEWEKLPTDLPDRSS
jgi:Arc/MetJ-type ribon-helix-helix transcriptional regulator